MAAGRGQARGGQGRRPTCVAGLLPWRSVRACARGFGALSRSEAPLRHGPRRDTPPVRFPSQPRSATRCLLPSGRAGHEGRWHSHPWSIPGRPDIKHQYQAIHLEDLTSPVWRMSSRTPSTMVSTMVLSARPANEPRWLRGRDKGCRGTPLRHSLGIVLHQPGDVGRACACVSWAGPGRPRRGSHRYGVSMDSPHPMACSATLIVHSLRARIAGEAASSRARTTRSKQLRGSVARNDPRPHTEVASCPGPSSPGFQRC